MTSSAKEHTAEIIMSSSESVYVPRHYDAAPYGFLIRQWSRSRAPASHANYRPTVRPSIRSL
jgi:hypothetical protein